MKRSTKLILLAAAIAIIIGILFLVLGKKITNGTLTVTSSDSAATITLMRIAPNSASVDTKGAVGKYTGALPAGTYTVTAQGKSASSQIVVEVKAGQTTTATIKFAAILQPETVASVHPLGLAADTTTLRYLDNDSLTLVRITSQNQLIHESPNQHFESVRWASIDFGVSRDTTGNMFIVQDSPSAINLPFTPDIKADTYAVAPNQDVYVSDGQKLWRGPAGNNFQLIYTSTKHIAIKDASSNMVLLAENATSNTKDETKLVTVDTAGHTNRADGESYDAVWSPSGNHALLNGDEISTVLDSRLKEVIRMPQGNVSTPVWLNEDTILYGVQNKLWRFNITTGQASQIADTGGRSIVHQYMSSDGSYVYLLTQDTATGHNQELQRVGLRNQPVAAPITILGLILPNTVSGCQMSFLNFTAPTVTVTGPKASAAKCTQAAQKYLQTYHVPANIGVSFSGI